MSKPEDKDDTEAMIYADTSSSLTALDELNALFAKGFTVPEHLRMNSVYGKSASDLPRQSTMPPLSLWTVGHAYFLAKRLRNILRVI